MHVDSLNVRPPAAGRLFLGLLALTAISASVAAFLDYSRKEMVPGYLQLAGGEVRLLAPARGTVTFALNPGQQVPEGGVVAQVSRSFTSALGDSTLAQRAILADKVDALGAEFHSADRAIGDRKAALTRQRQLAMATVEQAAMEADTRRAALSLEERKVERQVALQAQGMVSAAALDQARAELLLRRGDVQAAERAVTQSRWQVSSLDADLGALESERAAKVGALNRGKLDLADTRVAVEEGAKVAATAQPKSVVTTLAVSSGDTVEAGQLLAKLAPAGAKLEALLLLPPSAVARVKPGQTVGLQLAAFPYNTYGLVQARITRVETSSLLAGESSLRSEGVPNGDVVRKAYAELTTVPSAMGGLAALQNGMQVNAAVEVDRKSFLAWMTWPLLKHFQ